MGVCSSKEKVTAHEVEEKKEDELTELELNKIKSMFTYQNMVNYFIEEKKSFPVLHDEKGKFGARIDRDFIEFSFMDREKIK